MTTMMIKYNPKAMNRLLKEHSLSQSEFARKIDVSRQLVFNWLTLGDQPRADILMSIANVFNKPMSFFFISKDKYSSKRNRV
jgi:transcriptional regulator with XRE-family HTH domain